MSTDVRNYSADVFCNASTTWLTGFYRIYITDAFDIERKTKYKSPYKVSNSVPARGSCCGLAKQILSVSVSTHRVCRKYFRPSLLKTPVTFQIRRTVSVPPPESRELFLREFVSETLGTRAIFGCMRQQSLSVPSRITIRRDAAVNNSVRIVDTCFYASGSQKLSYQRPLNEHKINYRCRISKRFSPWYLCRL